MKDEDARTLLTVVAVVGALLVVAGALAALLEWMWRIP